MTDAELVQRLEALERHNRRLKRLGVAALALVAAPGAIYATRPVPQTITAHEFDVTDSQGNIRVKIRVVGYPPYDVPRISLLGENDKEQTIIQGGLADDLSTVIDAGMLIVSDGNNYIAANADDPSVFVKDSKGFFMELGSGDIAYPSGAKTQTSAASITMFSNDQKHHVIWQAP